MDVVSSAGSSSEQLPLLSCLGLQSVTEPQRRGDERVSVEEVEVLLCCLVGIILGRNSSCSWVLC